MNDTGLRLKSLKDLDLIIVIILWSQRDLFRKTFTLSATLRRISRRSFSEKAQRFKKEIMLKSQVSSLRL